MTHSIDLLLNYDIYRHESSIYFIQVYGSPARNKIFNVHAGIEEIKRG